jgi:hypothetical protein
MSDTPPPKHGLLYSPYPQSSPNRPLFQTPPPVRVGSLRQTPVDGFSKEDIKAMAKVWNSPAKFMEILQLTMKVYYEEEVDENRVADIVSSLLKTDVIPFPFND